MEGQPIHQLETLDRIDGYRLKEIVDETLPPDDFHFDPRLVLQQMLDGILRNHRVSRYCINQILRFCLFQ